MSIASQWEQLLLITQQLVTLNHLFFCLLLVSMTLTADYLRRQ